VVEVRRRQVLQTYGESRRSLEGFIFGSIGVEVKIGEKLRGGELRKFCRVIPQPRPTGLVWRMRGTFEWAVLNI